jgi:hypothetical protein
VSGFTRSMSGHVRGRFDDAERRTLSALAEQLVQILETAPGASDFPGEDPAFSRLLPDAYPEDADASTEFRRFTSEEIVQRKIENARAVVASLTQPDPRGRVPLDEATTQAWLRTLTDLRLVLATRLGIEQDGDEGRVDDEGLALQRLYTWFGYLQESLLHALG